MFGYRHFNLKYRIGRLIGWHFHNFYKILEYSKIKKQSIFLIITYTLDTLPQTTLTINSWGFTSIWRGMQTLKESEKDFIKHFVWYIKVYIVLFLSLELNDIIQKRSVGLL